MPHLRCEPEPVSVWYRKEAAAGPKRYRPTSCQPLSAEKPSHSCARTSTSASVNEVGPLGRGSSAEMIVHSEGSGISPLQDERPSPEQGSSQVHPAYRFLSGDANFSCKLAFPELHAIFREYGPEPFEMRSKCSMQDRIDLLTTLKSQDRGLAHQRRSRDVLQGHPQSCTRHPTLGGCHSVNSLLNLTCYDILLMTLCSQVTNTVTALCSLMIEVIYRQSLPGVRAIAPPKFVQSLPKVRAITPDTLYLYVPLASSSFSYNCRHSPWISRICNDLDRETRHAVPHRATSLAITSAPPRSR